MKDSFVPKTVTLPEKLLTWAEEKVRRQAQSEYQAENFSAYVRDLIVRDKQESNGKKANGK